MKYYYDGIPLKQFCLEKGLNYEVIVKKYHQKYADFPVDEAIKKIVDELNSSFRYKYFVDGISLSKFCKINGYSHSTLSQKIKKLYSSGKLNKQKTILKREIIINLTRKEIIQLILEETTHKREKYYYKGVPLKQFCEFVGLSYTTVVNKHLEKYSNCPVDESIEKIVDEYILNPPSNLKYSFNGESLAEFCRIKGYSYTAICQQIRSLENKEGFDTKEKRINEAVKKYEQKFNLLELSNLLKKLYQDSFEEENLTTICDKLNISYRNVLKLKKLEYSYPQAINMIWFFSDKKDKDNNLVLSNEKLKNILSLSKNLKEKNTNIDECALYDLIAIYKCKLYDSRIDILFKQRYYIRRIIFSLCYEYGVKIDSYNYNDFEGEVILYFLKILEGITLNTKGQVIKYIDLSIKGYFRTFLKSYSNHINNISLNTTDYLKKIKANDVEPKTKDFSNKMKEILSNLDKISMAFIILKFKKGYSNEEISYSLNISLKQVKQKEEEILKLLKNNEEVLKLLKQKITI